MILSNTLSTERYPNRNGRLDFLSLSPSQVPVPSGR